MRGGSREDKGTRLDIEVEILKEVREKPADIWANSPSIAHAKALGWVPACLGSKGERSTSQQGGEEIGS